MNIKEFADPIFNQGIRHINFFNGRLLTAEDARVEQEANQRQLQQLGQAAGNGIVHGLEVYETSTASLSTKILTTSVNVSAGLAINREGETLCLPINTNIALVREKELPASQEGRFTDCHRPQPRLTGANSGIYILSVTPASGFEGHAQAIGHGNNGQIIGCDRRFAVQGVRFKLVRVDLNTLPTISDITRQQLSNLLKKTNPACLSTLRNVLAHLCFGTEELIGKTCDPYAFIDEESPHARYGTIDHIRRHGALAHDGTLTNRDVPLALLYWTSRGIQFLDMWCVRRRLISPFASNFWLLSVGRRRQAEAEAMFLQFQQHLEDIERREPHPSSIEVANWFRFLPPAAILSHRFPADVFFKNVHVERFRIDQAFVRWLIHQSWFLPPMDLHHDPHVPPLRVYDVASDQTGSLTCLIYLRGERRVEHLSLCDKPMNQDLGTALCMGKLCIDIDIDERQVACAPVTTICGVDLATACCLANLGIRTVGQLASQNPTAVSAAFCSDPSKAITAIKAAADICDAGRLRTAPGKTVLDHVDITVCAVDELGHEYPARFVPVGSTVQPGRGREITFHRGSARFIVDTLAPGPYLVKVKMKGWMEARQKKEICACLTSCVEFKLAPARREACGRITKPLSRVRATWLSPHWYGKMIMVGEKSLNWPWPLEGWQGREPVSTVTSGEQSEWKTEVEEWQTWTNQEADYLGQAYQDAPIDPGKVNLYIDPTYTPGSIVQNPYAYLVFGECGAHIPVLLTPIDRTLSTPVSLSRGGFSWDPCVEEELMECGITKLDELAASWTDVVAHAAHVSLETAATIIRQAQEVVASLSQDPLTSFVNPDDREKLSANDIGTKFDLTNQHPQKLSETTGLSIGQTAFYIEQARMSANENVWSLDALGLTPSDIEILNAENIRTQGMFRNAVATQEGKRQIGSALNITPAQIDHLVQKSLTFTQEAETASIAETPVTRVFGVTPFAAQGLAKLGFGTIGSLATINMDNEALIRNIANESFQGRREEAVTVINTAKTTLGVTALSTIPIDQEIEENIEEEPQPFALTLPVSTLRGIGPEFTKDLNAQGIQSIEDLANMSEDVGQALITIPPAKLKEFCMKARMMTGMQVNLMPVKALANRSVKSFMDENPETLAKIVANPGITPSMMATIQEQLGVLQVTMDKAQLDRLTLGDLS